jgi:hypothetical protein
MLNSGKQFSALRDKKKKYSNSRVLNETKNHTHRTSIFALSTAALPSPSVRQLPSKAHHLSDQISGSEIGKHC